MANINITLEKSLHKKARIICAIKGITLSEFYDMIIRERLSKDIKHLKEVIK